MSLLVAPCILGETRNSGRFSVDTSAATPASIPGSETEKSQGSDALGNWYQLDPFPVSPPHPPPPVRPRLF